MEKWYRIFKEKESKKPNYFWIFYFPWSHLTASLRPGWPSLFANDCIHCSLKSCTAMFFPFSVAKGALPFPRPRAPPPGKADFDWPHKGIHMQKNNPARLAGVTIGLKIFTPGSSTLRFSSRSNGFSWNNKVHLEFAIIIIDVIVYFNSFKSRSSIFSRRVRISFKSAAIQSRLSSETLLNSI